MSVALDPRIGVDRVFQYGDYMTLAMRYRRRKKNAWYQDFIKAAVRPRKSAVRLWPYKLALGLGSTVLAVGFGLFSVVSADSARLEYKRQDVESSLSGLAQARSEAVEQKVADQTAVLVGDNASTTGVYPEQTNYVVLTNIPDTAGHQLVEELYPLSRRMITVEP